MSLVSDPLNQAYLSPLKLSKGYGWVTQGTEVQIKTLFTFVNIRSTPPPGGYDASIKIYMK